MADTSASLSASHIISSPPSSQPSVSVFVLLSSTFVSHKIMVALYTFLLLLPSVLAQSASQQQAAYNARNATAEAIKGAMLSSIRTRFVIVRLSSPPASPTSSLSLPLLHKPDSSLDKPTAVAPWPCYVHCSLSPARASPPESDYSVLEYAPVPSHIYSLS